MMGTESLEYHQDLSGFFGFLAFPKTQLFVLLMEPCSVALTDESRDGDSSSTAYLGKVLWSPRDFTVCKYFLLHNINCLFQFNRVVLSYIIKVLP